MRTRLGVEASEDLVAVAEASEGARLSKLGTSGARAAALRRAIVGDLTTVLGKVSDELESHHVAPSETQGGRLH